MQFSQKMPLYLFYTMVQKSQKWPKTQIKGGAALKPFPAIAPPPPSTLHLSILSLPQITKLHAKNKLQSMQIDVPEIQAVSLLSVMTVETIFPDNAIGMVIVDVLIDLEM